MGLSQECKTSSVFKSNQSNPLYGQPEKEKPHDCINWFRERIWENVVSILEKALSNKNRNKLTHPDKWNLQKPKKNPTVTAHQSYCWEIEHPPPLIGSKETVPLSPLFINITLEVLVSITRQEKWERGLAIVWKARNKTVLPLRWHDCQNRKFRWIF